MRQRPSHFELRCYAGRDLYERVLREAAARRVSVSECLRSDLSKYYAIQDEMAGVVEVNQLPGAQPGRRILHTLLAEMETRLVASMDRQSSVFEESLRAVAWMIDRGLLMLLGRGGGRWAAPSPAHGLPASRRPARRRPGRARVGQGDDARVAADRPPSTQRD